MKLEEQVLSIDQMRHLKELGVEVKNTSMCWAKWSILTAENKWCEFYRVCFHDEDYKFSIPTLTLQEILEMLPKDVSNRYSCHRLYYDAYHNMMKYSNSEYLKISYSSDNVLNAAYKMLCWCIENGYLNASNSMSLNKE